MEDAISYGQAEIIKKFRIDSARDNPTRLLSKFIVCPNVEIQQMLLNAGAEPNGSDTDRSPMHNLIQSLAWELESTFGRTDPEPSLKCIELLASRGGRWRPTKSYDLSGIRRALAKADSFHAISCLNRVIKSGAIERQVFVELMKTPRMKTLLASSAPGVAELRDFAGHKVPRPRESEYPAKVGLGRRPPFSFWRSRR